MLVSGNRQIQSKVMNYGNYVNILIHLTNERRKCGSNGPPKDFREVVYQHLHERYGSQISSRHVSNHRQTHHLV